jgi:hypothetical protein
VLKRKPTYRALCIDLTSRFNESLCHFGVVVIGAEHEGCEISLAQVTAFGVDLHVSLDQHVCDLRQLSLVGTVAAAEFMQCRATRLGKDSRQTLHRDRH